MRSSKQKLIITVGPTASGKSELAVQIAKRFNGEIISADSRQIYRGLSVGSGMVPGKWQTALGGSDPTIVGSDPPRPSKRFIYKSIFHHCIDFVSPRRIFTVAEFKKCAKAAIQDISARGKIPILVGGTGFWIDAVVYDLNLPEVPPNPMLRRKLEKKNATELFAVLKKLDPERAKTVEQKNPRRLIRAIEIANTIGKSPKIAKKETYQTLWLGLLPSYETWSHKIERRARNMVGNGLVGETKKLLEREISKKRIKEFGFEYQAALDCLEKKISREELKKRLVQDTFKYAKRQMTWFKRNRKIRWINNKMAIKKIAAKFLNTRY